MKFIVLGIGLSLLWNSCKKTASESISIQNKLILGNEYEKGPAEPDAAIAFNLANEFIKKEKDSRGFTVTDPSVQKQGDNFEVTYKTTRNSEIKEAVVLADVKNKTCRRLKL